MVKSNLMGALGWIFASPFVVAPAVAQGEGKETWTLTCQSVTVDTCAVSCPCLMGLAPHHGACTFINGFKIKEGHCGKVSLGGLSWAMMGEFTGPARTPKFSYVAFYLPKDATDEQKKALRSIINSSPFADLSKPLGITELEVKVVVPSSELGEYGLRIGDKGSFKITPVTGTKDPEMPIKVKNPVYPFPVAEITVGRAEGRFSDHGKELDLTENSGEIGAFTLSGTTSGVK
jgi:hypothetical protein